MKFQAAAMARADMAEQDREDFCLFVDEFQNFATESFESILSEARKYRLNLVLGNQFMTQLTDKIREAIIGNVGTVISGRIGVTDAELMVKKFQPVFDAEDLTKLPNYQAITSVMINNVPSAPFSMSLLPPMNQANPQLADAMKRLSATKYGYSRAVVEKEIFARLEPPRTRPGTPGGALPPGTAGRGPSARPMGASPSKGGGGSFLDEWLAKRQKAGMNTPSSRLSPQVSAGATKGVSGTMTGGIENPHLSQQTSGQISSSVSAVPIQQSRQQSSMPPAQITNQLQEPPRQGVSPTQTTQSTSSSPQVEALPPLTTRSSSGEQEDSQEVSIRLR